MSWDHFDRMIWFGVGAAPSLLNTRNAESHGGRRVLRNVERAFAHGAETNNYGAPYHLSFPSEPWGTPGPSNVVPRR